MKIESETLTPDSTDMSSSIETNAAQLDHMIGYSIQTSWSGAPVGNFSLEGSVNGTTFVEITGTTVAAGGTSGNVLYNIINTFYRYTRLNYVASSGTGTLGTVHYMLKGP